MSSDSGQKFIKRNRPPRVQISYEDPYDSQRQIELPFVMGVMSDLSGNASQVDKPAVADRKFSDVDMDNVDKYMKSVAPAASFRSIARSKPVETATSAWLRLAPVANALISGAS